ncbi:MAG TPA: divergent PAP2 family protein [Candidatus Limiplasma sp.]|nr:divergent PAP2 family protein [Candidatus Limiplasma sp.]
MHNIDGILVNHVVLCSLCAWFIAQAMKIPLYYRVEHRWDWGRFVGSGGMPSSHTAMVIALSISVGVLNGFDTALFGICFVLSTIVMYDATGVRREAGTQATVINQILKDVLINGKRISDEELKELVGHTPFEVLGGVIVGLVTALLYFWLVAI